MKIKAKKQFGQNFLHDEYAITRIVDALDLASDDTVIEIGPGTGALTSKIAERARRVIAIEFDRDLVAHLERAFADRENVTIVSADALSIDFATLNASTRAKVAANLPYNISTAILQRLIDHRGSLDRMVLMFQREVVDRIAAKPASKDRGFLSVIAQDAFEIERLFDVPPTAFSPVPRVWSSVVRLTPTEGDIVNKKAKLDLVSRSFAQKRKTILNNLKPFYPTASECLSDANIDPIRRAETLTIDEWQRLADGITKG